MSDSCEHRTLPPKVKGKLHGHLTVIVDEIVWCGKQTENVIVQTKWWGDDKPITFRPCNIANLIETQNRNMKVMFDIRTNEALFENYLRNCKQLEFCIIKEDSRELIGKAFLFEPHQIIEKTHFEKYCPISNPLGIKLGDLHIIFNLWLKQQRLPAEKEGENIYSLVSSSSNDEQVRPLHKRRGCKACTKHMKMTSKVSPRKKMKSDMIEEKPLHGSVDASEKSNTVPPNTARSDHSEALLSDICERAEKLRKAMVMSILEDCNISNIEQELSELDRQSKIAVKDEILRNFISQNYSNISSAVTETRVMDYLLGKEMSKEEEIQALKTLRTISPLPNVLDLGNLERPGIQTNSDEYCLSSGREYHRYAEKSSAKQETDIPTSRTTRSECIDVLQQKESETHLPEWCKKVNSVRISVELLKLTASGIRKMHSVLQRDSKHSRNLTRNLLAPSSVTYFIEAYFTENIDNTTSRTWKHKPNDRFCSRKEVENVIYFGQSCIRYLNTPFSMKSMNSWLLSSQWIVFWRHLNHRIPSSLGGIIMENLPSEPYLENIFTFPVATENTVNGYARLKIELGKGKHCFGYSLTTEENQSAQPSRSTKISNSIKASLPHKTYGKLRYNEDIKENIEPALSSIDKACQSELEVDTSDTQYNRISGGNFSFSYDNLISKDLTMCPNCAEYQNVKVSEPRKVKYPSVYFPLEKFYSCSICKTSFTKRHKQDEVLSKQTVPDIQYRVNEFVIGIENVEDVLFSKESYEDLACYVDYRFFQTDVPGYVKMSAVDFTSKIVNCSSQTYFSTVHRHCLCLPDNIPLTTTLGSFCPGISFRLWIRRFTPSPRDHMAAVALLPLDKICSFDWKFDSKNKDDPVIEVFDLPLTLVKSLSALDLVSTKQNTCGKLRVSVSYRKYNNETSQVLSHEQVYTEKEEVLINAGQTDDFDKELGSNDKREYNKIKNRDNYSKQYEENSNSRVYSSLSETAKLRDEELGDPVDRISKETMKHIDYSENELRYLRRRFWTGEYERNHYGTSTKPYSGISNHDQVLDVNKTLKCNSKISEKRVDFNSENDFKKNYQDLTYVHDYRFHDAAYGLDSNNSKYRSRVNFQDSDYDIKMYRLKHRSYDSLTDGLNKLYSEEYPSHTNLRGKYDDAHSYRAKHVSYEDVREGLYVSDIKARSSKQSYNLNKDRLTQKSYESLRDTETIDLRYGTHEKQFKVSFTESVVDSSCHKLNEQLTASHLRHESGKNYSTASDSDVIGCSYKYSSDLVDVDKRYGSSSDNKSLPVETCRDQTCWTNEPLHDIKHSSVDLVKTNHSCIRTNSNHDNTVSDVMVNSDHVPLTAGESKSTLNKSDGQHYNNGESDYHKMSSDIQNSESAETVGIFTVNKDGFDADKSEDSILESHMTYTDGKSVENLCDAEHSASESKQNGDKLNKCDESFRSSESESQGTGEHIKQFQESVSNVMGLNQASHNSQEYFKACVEIEQAMHLPMRRRYVNGIPTVTQPSTYVTFKVASEDRDVLYSTGVIQENCNPIWNKSWRVELPVELLQETDKRLVFCICEEDMGRDLVLGHAAADLTLFLYGLPFLRSWINVNDFRATCIGQIKINIMPLEDISRYQKNSVMSRDRVQAVRNIIDSTKFCRQQLCFTNSSGNTSDSKVIFQQSRRNDNGELECEKSEMILGEKLAELDSLIHRFEKRLYVSSESGLSEVNKRLSHNSFPERECDATVTVMNTHVTDTDEINQCSHHDDRIRTNANAESVNEIITSDHSEANRNIEENVTRTSHNNCDHCLCHYCPHISDISGSDNIRLQYLLNPLVFHHLLANISQIARTEVLTSNPGHQTEFSNDELISRPLASGMSAPEEELCKNDTDTSILELEQFFNHSDKGDCQTHHVNQVENPFLPSSSNSLLHSETPQLDRENPEGRGDKKKPEKVATRLQRQSTFVIEKKIGCSDNAEAHSK